MQSLGTKRSGITAAGNWIIDNVKLIDTYPEQNSLANIKNEQFSNGGSPYTILKNLSRLGASFPLSGIGLIGDDEFGSQIKNDCVAYDINAEQLQVLAGSSTSYTDVMTVESSGRRTFFHQRGASSFLDEQHFDFSDASGKLFHLGYLLLLNALDTVYDDDSTGASRVLKRACASGFKTSVDLVSEDSPRFKQVVFPALPYIDYLFLNEFEAYRCTGIELAGEPPEYATLNKVATSILDHGVREWVFLHFPEGVFARSKTGNIIIQGSLNLPLAKIKGASGAGDALASGILYAIHEEWSIEEALKLGVCCAASSLMELGSSEGVKPYRKCLQMGAEYGYRQLKKSINGTLAPIKDK